MTDMVKAKPSRKDVDALANAIAQDVWNSIIDHPALHVLKPQHFADIFEAVQKSLHRYL